MKVLYKKTIPGADTNEDYVYADETYAYILDGAGDLSKQKKFNAKWYVTKFSTIFNNLIEDDLIVSLKKTVKEMRKLILNNNLEKNYEIPSAGMAFIREKDKFIELCQIGDLPIIILNKDNSFKVFDGDKKLAILDKKALDKIDELAKTMPKHKAVEEVRKTLLIENRNLKNQDNGYIILDINSSILNQVKVLKLKKENIKKIILMSDGFAQIYSTMKVYTKGKTVEKIDEGKFNDLFMSLKQSQMEDIELKHTRFKVSDDASLIVLEILD